ncbi:MAG: coproporphyrinogen-III oxidase family protein, partial [Pseudomonadota bacterium]
MLFNEDDGQPGFGVYVHWPFCAAKCPYCDFNSHVRHGGVDQARYARALATEVNHMAAMQPGQKVTSVFFGGGTPSLMEPDTVAHVLQAIDTAWGLDEGIEITLEANPTSVEADRFRAYRAAGVNRVSLGVQSLDDAQLKFLGRLHSAREAMDAIETARAIFPRFSFDLIYARPDQTLKQWEAELRAALALSGGHLSLYQLTIEQETPFH